jgi:hypothetical protein
MKERMNASALGRRGRWGHLSSSFGGRRNDPDPRLCSHARRNRNKAPKKGGNFRFGIRPRPLEAIHTGFRWVFQQFTTVYHRLLTGSIWPLQPAIFAFPLGPHLIPMAMLARAGKSYLVSSAHWISTGTRERAHFRWIWSTQHAPFCVNTFRSTPAVIFVCLSCLVSNTSRLAWAYRASYVHVYLCAVLPQGSFCEHQGVVSVPLLPGPPASP